jgi:hypothetical protein
MSEMLEIQFASVSTAPAATLVLLAGQETPGAHSHVLRRAHEGRSFKGGARADFTGQDQDERSNPGTLGIDAAALLLIGTGRPRRSWTVCCSRAMRWPRSVPARVRWQVFVASPLIS